MFLWFFPLFSYSQGCYNPTAFLTYPPHFCFPAYIIPSVFGCVFTNSLVSSLSFLFIFASFPFSFSSKNQMGLTPKNLVAQQMIYVTHRKDHNNHIQTRVSSRSHSNPTCDLSHVYLHPITSINQRRCRS